jgi:glycosidase
VLLTLPGLPFLYYGEELGMEGVYDEYFNEEQLEPFLWYENGYGPGQTEWKALGKNRPHSGLSIQAQSDIAGSYFERFKNILRFRRDNPWLRFTTIKSISRKKELIRINLHGGEGNAFLYHNTGSSRATLDTAGTPVVINGTLERHRGRWSLAGLSSAIEVLNGE